MKSVYLIFLVTLLAVISTPANAARLGKKWDKECCPVSACVFNQGEVVNPAGLPNYVKNTFNGILSFTESPQNTLQVSGFIDIDGVTSRTIGDFPFWDLHVAPCKPDDPNQPGDPATLDLDDKFFDKPILTSFADVSIKDIENQCCFVVEEYASLGPVKGGSPSKPLNERILGIAPVQPVVSCQ